MQRGHHCIFCIVWEFRALNCQIELFVIGLTITGLANFKIFDEVPSWPVAFLIFSRPICLLTNSSSTGLKWRSDCTVRFSFIFIRLGCSSLMGIEFSPILFARLTKKSLKMLQTSCWPLINLSFSSKIVSF